MARPETPVGAWGKTTVRRDGDAWVAQAWYRDYDGVSRRVRRWGATKGQANSSLHDALQNRRRPGGDEITSETRLAELGEKWLANKRAEGLAYRSISRYQDVLKGINGSIGSLRVREATTGRIDKYLSALAEKTPANAKTASSVLSGMLGLAARHDAIPVNPVRGLAKQKREKAQPRALTPEGFIEFRTLLGRAAAGGRGQPTPAMQTLLDIEDFMIATGARTAEALAEQWSHIDIATGIAEIGGTVYRRLPEDGGGLHIQPHTKARDQRVLKLPAFCLAMLKRRREVANGTLVFESSAGTIIDPNTYRSRRRRLLAGTGYEWVTPRIARKSVATALDRELGSEAAASQLGNTKKVAEEHYIEKARQVVDHAEILEAFGISKPSVNRQ